MTESFQKIVAEYIEYEDLNQGLQFIAEMTDMDIIKNLIIKLNGSGESFNFPNMDNYKKAIKKAINHEFPDKPAVFIARKIGLNVRTINKLITDN